MRQKDDIAGAQFSPGVGFRILENRSAADNDVVGYFVGCCPRPGNAPWRAIGAADLR